jgi:hypothetical protein
MRVIPLSVAAVLLAASGGAALGDAIRPGFNANTLARNDDESTGSVSLGFSGSLNFFGASISSGFVNNNGNMTFDSALGTYTPFNLNTTNRQIIAPFFADVDTRNASFGDAVTYGTGTVGGRDAFGVNWVNVGFYNALTAPFAPTNSFQLVIVERFDTGVGNFDFEFNYGAMAWESGEASGGNANGLGGNAARAGWNNGLIGMGNESFEVAGSGINSPNGGLIDRLDNTCIVFEVRNGQISVVPLPPAAWAGLGGMGLAFGLTAIRRRRLR